MAPTAEVAPEEALIQAHAAFIQALGSAKFTFDVLENVLIDTANFSKLVLNEQKKTMEWRMKEQERELKSLRRKLDERKAPSKKALKRQIHFNGGPSTSNRQDNFQGRQDNFQGVTVFFITQLFIGYLLRFSLIKIIVDLGIALSFVSLKNNIQYGV